MCGNSGENRFCRKCDFHCRHNFGSKGCFHCMQVSYSDFEPRTTPYVHSMMITNSHFNPSHKIDLSEEMSLLSQSVHPIQKPEQETDPQSFNQFVTLFQNRHQTESESSPKVSKTPLEDLKPLKSKRKRCGLCSKKLSLTAFPCHCDEFFCEKHRYSNEHNCSYDYKSTGKLEILKDNPKITAEKLVQF